MIHATKPSAVVLIINIINFIQQRFGAGRSMNTATAESPLRYRPSYIMNVKLLLFFPLVLVFSCENSSQTKASIDSIRIVDDRTVQPTPPPPPSLPYEETIQGWIEYLGVNERPSKSIVAYHFELIKSDTIYTLRLTGSSSYQKDSFDWTTNEDYAPYFKFCRLDQKETKGLSDMQVFDRANYLISSFLNTASGKQSFLKKAKRVTLGYAEEQITQLY